MEKNKDWWNSPKEAVEMYDKYSRLAEGRPGGEATPFSEWMYKNADSALELEIGQIVQFKDGMGDLRFAVVADYNSYCTESSLTFSCVRLKMSGNNSTFVDVNSRIRPAYERAENMKCLDIKFADVPEEILSAVGKCSCERESLRDRCPFRDEWKDPVPPCMKEDEHE